MKYRLYVMNKLSKIHPYVWIGIIILFALILRLYHITYPMNDAFAWRHTQTAGLIRDYYRSGINLLYPTMITLGVPGYVVLEFPLYQALSAILYNVFVPDVITARFLSILFGLLSIVFVYRLCIKFLDNKSALLACLFYGFMPLNIFFQRVPMPESLTIFLSLAMLDLLIEGIRGKRLPLILGIVAAATGLVMKSPFVAPLYLPLMYVSYRHGGIRSLIKPRFMAALFIPLTIMLIWQNHANYVNHTYFNTDAYPFKQLYNAVVVKFKPINTWYFGTIEQRTQLQNYKILWERLSRELLSGFGFIFLAAGFFALIKKKVWKFFYIWLFAVFVSIMVFFNLHVVHDYYQLPLAAVLSVFCGAGAAYIVELIRNKSVAVAVVSIILILHLYGSWSFTEKHLFWEDSRDYIKIGQFIDDSTEKNALIGISTPGNDVWEPTYMYYADRHGFVVPLRRLNKDMIEYLKSKNIRYLAITDYSNIYDAVVKLLYPYKIRAYNQNVIIYDIQTLQK